MTYRGFSTCSASATISQRCARTPWLERLSLVPAETSVDLFSACNVRSPSVMASCLERKVSDERATSIAASPLQISQPNGRPGGPRRLVTSRNGDALSMPASKVALYHGHATGKRNVNGAGFQTASLPTRRDPVRLFAERPARYWDNPNFRSNRGAKKSAAHDGFGRRPARDSVRQFGKLRSQSLHVAMRIACNPRTLFSNLFVLFVAVVSRPACSISDNRSRW
jgi:hypothetical protein